MWNIVKAYTGELFEHKKEINLVYNTSLIKRIIIQFLKEIHVKTESWNSGP